MNIWLHRISHQAEASYPLIENGNLTIGFSDVASSEFLEKTKSGDGNYFEEEIASTYGCMRSRHSLWRFIVEMQVGDWVVVPSWGSFSIYRIEGEVSLIKNISLDEIPQSDLALILKNDSLYIGDNHIDLGFFRKVSPIAINISRYDFADSALTSRMKIRNTNANITDLTESVKKALDAYKNKKPVNLHSQILESSRDQLLERIQKELNPDKLEALVEWYFRRLGASSVIRTAKNERDKQGDADIIAIFEPLKTIYYIQAKHHTGMTTDWAVQQVREYKDQKDSLDDGYTNIGWVVSTADEFSDEFIRLAKEHSVRHFSGREFAQMILEAGIQNLDKAF